jgi:ketosteroid isomerase-like protein
MKIFLFVALAAGLGHAQGMKEEIVARERGGLEALKTGDIAALGDAIAEDAVFVDASGPAGKAQVVKNLAGFRPRVFTIPDIKFVPLSADTGLIVYLIDETEHRTAKDFPRR